MKFKVPLSQPYRRKNDCLSGTPERVDFYDAFHLDQYEVVHRVVGNKFILPVKG